MAPVAGYRLVPDAEAAMPGVTELRQPRVSGQNWAIANRPEPLCSGEHRATMVHGPLPPVAHVHRGLGGGGGAAGYGQHVHPPSNSAGARSSASAAAQGSGRALGQRLCQDGVVLGSPPPSPPPRTQRQKMAAAWGPVRVRHGHGLALPLLCCEGAVGTGPVWWLGARFRLTPPPLPSRPLWAPPRLPHIGSPPSRPGRCRCSAATKPLSCPWPLYLLRLPGVARSFQPPGDASGSRRGPPALPPHWPCVH